MRWFFALFLLLPMVAKAQLQPCTTTLSPGANVVTAASSAANGSVICLNSGTWATQNFFNVSRSGYVTIRSTNPASQTTVNVNVGNSSFLRFRNLVIPSNVTVNSCSTNIQFISTNHNGGGILFDASSCPNSTHNYLIDGSDFTNGSQSLFEGRVNCRDCNGAVIRNSLFVGIGAEPSDGIQTQGNTRNFTIGPGNTFSGILESLCGAVHCDAIQFQAGGTTLVTGNLFENGDTFIMSPDGCSNVTVEHNIFNGNGVAYPDKIQFGSCSNPIFRHNTVYNVRASFDSKTGEAATTNALAENNIMHGGSSFKTANGSGCTGCTFRFNLYNVSGNATGTNNIIGTPTFTSGAPPSFGVVNIANWRLATGSLGKAAGNDGKDMGTLFFRPAAPVLQVN